MTWSIELSQYDIRYEPRQAIKAQAMADFLVEVTGDPTEETSARWKLHVDGASHQNSGGAGIILESPVGVVYEQSIRFEFPVSNNQAEYKALIGGLTLAAEVGATRLEICSDSQVVTSQAEPLASISSSNCRKFMWRQVITRFGIPEIVISDNGTQFTDKKFTEFLTGLGIRQKFSLAEHPQTNGQMESANKIILLGLKKRLDNKKGAWADELASVLWSYRTTEQSSTKETPYRLTYGLDAVIPVEVGEPSPRLLLKGVGEAVEKNLIDEAREMAHLTEIALKQRVALRYNAKVLKREFEPNDLVLRRNDIGLSTPGEGKLATNWEGPYRVKEVMGKGAFKLERLDGKEIPRTWNASNLRRFYS
ncbi:uncharacterized protein LOC130945550 [Arachis stenosperma]|uniref:uncharacterized protein LOC130945550 n=1 Tax=Arachis stenosperma TaxID=217475 RepID=UPI0025ABB447|nr:uncharacterized protein LOC130945550 [Arachis stenosperma]